MLDELAGYEHAVVVISIGRAAGLFADWHVRTRNPRFDVSPAVLLVKPLGKSSVRTPAIAFHRSGKPVPGTKCG
jgi:hypothetical protein